MAFIAVNSSFVYLAGNSSVSIAVSGEHFSLNMVWKYLYL